MVWLGYGRPPVSKSKKKITIRYGWPRNFPLNVYVVSVSLIFYSTYQPINQLTHLITYNIYAMLALYFILITIYLWKWHRWCPLPHLDLCQHEKENIKTICYKVKEKCRPEWNKLHALHKNSSRSDNKYYTTTGANGPIGWFLNNRSATKIKHKHLKENCNKSKDNNNNNNNKNNKSNDENINPQKTTAAAAAVAITITIIKKTATTTNKIIIKKTAKTHSPYKKHLDNIFPTKTALVISSKPILTSASLLCCFVLFVFTVDASGFFRVFLSLVELFTSHTRRRREWSLLAWQS